MGLGHAVWCARHLVGDEPFAVLLPDDLMVGTPGALTQMVDAYDQVGGGIIVAAEEKPREETQRYGVIKPGRGEGHDHRGQRRGGKTRSRQDAPSTLCIIGRYILQPEIFGELDRRERGAGNEIQLTDAMDRLIGRVPFHAVTTDPARAMIAATRWASSTPISRSGLARPDIAPALKSILKTLKY